MLSALFRAALVLALCAAPLSAKPLARILKDTGLSPGDFEKVMAVEQSLIADGQPGYAETWSNPDTGATGRSQIIGRESGCISMQHAVTEANATEPLEFRSRFCQQPDGQWLRAPQG